MTDEKLALLTRIYDYDPYKSKIIQTTLASYDIPCFLFDENTVTTMPHLQVGLGGVRIMVPKEHLTTAQEILQKHQDHKAEETEPLLPNTKKGIISSMLSAFIYLITGIPVPFKNKIKDDD